MDLIRVIEYFAKYPDRDGVLRQFSKSTSEFTEYAALKNYIEALPAALLPEIKDFIFTDDEKKLRDAVKNIKSFFLLIEWGPIVYAKPNEMKSRVGEWNFAINIAHPTDLRGYDQIESSILAAKALDLMLKLAKLMANEDREVCTNCVFLDCEVTISPIDPYLFHQCTGWSLSFRKNYNNKF